MERMERTNHLLDRIIAVFVWDNSNDLHMQHYMKLFNPNHNHSRVLGDRNEMEETGKDVKT